MTNAIPTIVLLKDEVQQFAGRRVIAVDRNTQVDTERLRDRKVPAFKTRGKHFLVCFNGFTVRIHFLMFGTYRVNQRKESHTGVKKRRSFYCENCQSLYH